MIFYSLIELHQKSHSFPVLTCLFSDTTQLLNKNRTHTFSIEYSLFSFLHSLECAFLIFDTHSKSEKNDFSIQRKVNLSLLYLFITHFETFFLYYQNLTFQTETYSKILQKQILLTGMRHLHMLA